MARELVSVPRIAVQQLCNSDTIVRTRASKACTCCRERKVKCNVTVTGIPCVNCVRHQMTCVVSGRKRRRFRTEELLPSRSLGVSASIGKGVGGQDSALTIDTFLASAPTTLDFESGGQVQPSKLFEIDGENQTSGSDYSSSNPVPNRKRTPSTFSVNQQYSMTHSYPTSSAPVQVPSTRTGVQLPRYIRALPHEFGQDDIEFLSKKGVFTLPNDELRTELLRSYARYVHYSLPLLDIENFVALIEENGPNQISLMLFHAVIFAAAAFIDFPLLQAQGYESIKSARKHLFQKAKLLYDFGYETDGIALVQTLLLMSYWYESPADQKGSWHWAGVALSYANAMGLHRNPTGHALTANEKRLRKRLWWSCILRDRLIALSSRRPLRIEEDDYDVPMLVLDDFDIDSQTPSRLLLSGDCDGAGDTAIRKSLARLCIESLRLCICIGHILTLQYTLSGLDLGSTPRISPMMLSPKRPLSGRQLSGLLECDQELDNWYGNLHPDCRLDLLKLNQCIDSRGNNELVLHLTTLNMVYATTISALHRPQILPNLPPQLTAKSLQELSRRRVKDATTEVTEVMRVLHDNNLTRFLPPIAVGVLIPATLVQILDITSHDQTVRDLSLKRFHCCMQILRKLQETYAAADSAIALLEAVAHERTKKDSKNGGQRERTTPAIGHEIIQPGRESSHCRDTGHAAEQSNSIESDISREAARRETSVATWQGYSGAEGFGGLNEVFEPWSEFLMVNDDYHIHLDMAWTGDFSMNIT